MARHSRHRSVDDYPPYDEPYATAGPWDPYPPRHPGRDDERPRRRQEPSYYDDRWSPRGRETHARDARQDPRRPGDSWDSRTSRDRLAVRGASEMRPNRRPYDEVSVAPATRARRGQSEAPSRPLAYASARDRPDHSHARSQHHDPRRAERDYSSHTRAREPTLRDQDGPRYHSRGRGYSQDRDLSEHRYPPRSADTRRARYHPESGGGAVFGSRRPQEDEEDTRFARPGRARTHPTHIQQPMSRGSPPHRGRLRNPSPEPYHPVPPAAAARSRSLGHPPPRSHSMPAARSSAADSPDDSKKSTTQKVATYAAVGAAARVALQAGAQAAYKLRDDPSPWVGEKGVRVATAALGAGIVDGIVGNKRSKMKRGGMRHKAMREAAELGLRQLVVQPVISMPSRKRRE